jgi:acetyltransferase-like isoleucine patch superfamily enzyme
MTKKQHFLFFMTKCFYEILNYITPLAVVNLIIRISDVFRCAQWSARLKKFGLDSFIFKNVIIHSPENVEIGARVSIGEFSLIWGNAGLSIGDGTLIAAGCLITTISHDDNAIIYRDTTTAMPIFIGENVWLGFGVRVMPGTSIGSNSIIGAGSVVTRDIPSGVVAFGSPARVVRILKQHAVIDLGRV